MFGRLPPPVTVTTAPTPLPVTVHVATNANSDAQADVFTLDESIATVVLVSVMNCADVESCHAVGNGGVGYVTEAGSCTMLPLTSAPPFSSKAVTVPSVQSPTPALGVYKLPLMSEEPPS